jgi:DNA polymerase
MQNKRSWVELSMDIETFSRTNLLTAGLYQYAFCPSFEILLFAWSYTRYYYDENNKLRYEDSPTKLVDLFNGEKIPADVLADMDNPDVIKTAHNVPFEFLCLSIYFSKYYPHIKLDGKQWMCTMVKAAMLGLPMSLDALGTAMNLPTKKDKEGKALIKIFCIPRKPPTRKRAAPYTEYELRTRDYPKDYPDKWERFKHYCKLDVEVEKQAKHRFAWFQMPESERELWALDQEINRRGIRIDTRLAEKAIEWDALFKKQTFAEAVQVTGLNNPNSVAQIKKWLSEAVKEEEEDVEYEETDTLNKDDIPKLLLRLDSEKIKRVLVLRQLLGKTSVRKYKRMMQMIGVNDRVRGSIQFCGAGRTWRFAGRGIQPHNYPRNELKLLKLARAIVRHGEMSALGNYFKESVPVILSQLLRTCFVPKPGHCFYVSDYAAIEARVLAWYAGEQWVLDVFNSHGKIYEATASMMFKIPLEAITKDSPWRQRGKVGDLAFGYQGAVGAAIKMKALDYGITMYELPGLVSVWRTAHPKTVQFWWDVHNAVKEVIKGGGTIHLQKGLEVSKKRGHLFIKLPSGRELVYVNPYLDKTEKGYDIVYWGMNQTSKKWERIKSYGGKFVENIVQATARDILKEGMLSVRKKYNIVMHIHDEIISEVPEGYGSLEEHNTLMCPVIPWAEGLPLKSAGFKGYYYKKE